MTVRITRPSQSVGVRKTWGRTRDDERGGGARTQSHFADSRDCARRLYRDIDSRFETCSIMRSFRSLHAHALQSASACLQSASASIHFEVCKRMLAVCKRMLAVCKRSLLARLFPCRLGNVLPHGTVAHEADRHAVACESRALCAVPPRVHLHVCGIHFHILGHRPKYTCRVLLHACACVFNILPSNERPVGPSPRAARRRPDRPVATGCLAVA